MTSGDGDGSASPFGDNGRRGRFCVSFSPDFTILIPKTCKNGELKS